MSNESNGEKIDTAIPEKKVKRQPLPSLCSHGKKRLYTCRLCHLDARKAGIIRPSAFCDLHDERKSRCKACTPGVSNDATTDEIDATPKKRAKIQEDPIFAPCPHGKKSEIARNVVVQDFVSMKNRRHSAENVEGPAFALTADESQIARNVVVLVSASIAERSQSARTVEEAVFVVMAN